MTPALKAMVEAMWAEIERQHRATERRTGKFDASIDMEKVARAGLAAIREPSAQMIVAGERVADCPDEAWPVMIDVIAKDEI
jgi:hypothetical protein